LKDVLVLFPNEWDRAELAAPRYAGRYRFHLEGFDLFRFPENLRLATFDARRFIDRIVARYRHAALDGVVSNEEQWGVLVAAVVAQRLGLPGPDPRAVLLAQNKFEARRRLAEALPAHTPRFAAFRPEIRNDRELGLPLPCFVKPVKATYSILARRVDAFEDVRTLLAFRPIERFILRKLIQPANDLAQDLGMRFAVDANAMIAEELLQGVQVTVEGFVSEGTVTTIGVVDAEMYPGTQAFRRFDYPSRLATGVQARLTTIAAQVVSALGLRHGAFNVELFHDAATDAITVIEVNPRLAYQFADLHEKVDGFNPYDAVLALATGEPIAASQREGRYEHAASFVLRTFARARLKSYPAPAHVAELAKRHEDVRLMVYVKTGAQLAREIKWLGSYRYAVLNVGARTPRELAQRFRDLEGSLAFEFG
jgi:biotin carboxylase